MFGFHDADYAGGIPPGLQYEVIGWYSDRKQDHLKTFISHFKDDYQRNNDNRQPTNDELLEAVKAEFKWTFTLAQFALRMIEGVEKVRFRIGLVESYTIEEGEGHNEGKPTA